MDFIDQVKQFSKRVATLKDNIQTEEATKTSLIMPFFALLGYDVFNPDEFIPEYTADVGIKKGEKVDYAIMADGQPIILIECKWIGENLQKHDSQLFRYFGTTQSKFAILTNGQFYRFYTDLEEPNKMDEKPFLEINILDIKESQVAELKKFHKSNFNLSEILDAASELKYSNEFKLTLGNELQNPSDEFVRLFLSSSYSGRLTAPVIEKFRPVIKKSLNNYINELMNDKIKSALGNDEDLNVPDVPETPIEPDKIEKTDEPKIETTPDELEAYFVIKNILKDIAPFSDVVYKDNERYMSILYKGNTRNWICRLYFGARKTIAIPDEKKKEVRYVVESVYQIEDYKDQLIAVLNRYL